MVKQTKRFAAIDIGSHQLKMKIVEMSGTGMIRPIETVDMLVPLGRDAFNDGRLSFESVKTTCTAIAGFKRLMNDYGVSDYRVVATSALREASNRDYMLDQIRIQTGFDVEIINNSQEKFLTYQAIKHKLATHPEIDLSEPTLFLDIGAGSIQLSLCEKGMLVSSQSMKLGALRIMEAMGKLEKHTLNFTNVLEEYIEAHLENVEYLKSSGDIAHFVVVSGALEHLLGITGMSRDDEPVSISRERLEKIYNIALSNTPRNLSDMYGIPYADAEIFMPSLILMRNFFDKTAGKQMLIPKVSLVDGIVTDYVHRMNGGKTEFDWQQDVLSCARQMAIRYKYNKKHSHYVEDIALQIFDSIQKSQALAPRDRFLLQIASIIHDVGKFIGADPHYIYSYNIIKASQLIGLSDTELAMVANISRFHSAEEPTYDNSSLKKIEGTDRLKTVKLIAIIRLADSLDTSHRQKLSVLSMRIRQGKFEIICNTQDEAVLEQWTFQMKSEFFMQVFGIRPQLTIKNKLLIN